MSYLTTLFGLEGKRAFVTGGGGGIGLMISRGLAGAGAHVIIASRQLEQCQAAAQAINDDPALPGSAEAFAADLSTEQGVNDAVEQLKTRTDSLNILINNSGRSWGQPFDQFPYPAWGKVMDLNVTAMFELTKQLTPMLASAASDDDPSRVVNVGSVMGTQPVAEGAYSYSTSKAAVHHMTRILARELAHKRITFNAIAPGPFLSGMTKFALGDDAKADAVAAKNPLGRLGTPEDAAGCTIFLCSRGGAYTSGCILPVDGGLNVKTGDMLFDAV